MVAKARVLAVDDEEPFLRALDRIVGADGRFELISTTDPTEAAAMVDGDDAIDVALVDPPGAHLVAIGCDLGTPASGGEVLLSVDAR